MTSAHERPMQITLGVILIISAAFLISVQDVVVKRFDGVLPLWQLFALRGLFTAAFLALYGWLFLKSVSPLAGVFDRWALIRGASIAIGLLAFYAALPFISLATAGAGIYLAPIFMTLLSARFLGEPVGARGWVAVILGFVGVLVLLRPGSDTFSPWALLPVFSAAFYALGHLLTRVKCQHLGSASLAFSYNVMMTSGAFLISALLFIVPPSDAMAMDFPFIFSGWSAPTPTLWGILAVMGVLFAGIGLLLAGAYKVAPPSTVGTFEYTYLIFAIIWDVTFFGIVPGLTTLIGIALIVVAGLLVLRRA